MTSSRTSANRRAGQKLRYLLPRERELWSDGYERVAGVDEAGMGPLAGPVVVAAVVFPAGHGLHGVNDSKQLSAARREALSAEIRAAALGWTIVEIAPREIDVLNIYRAGLEGMRRAVDALAPAPDYVLVDGRGIPGTAIPHEVIVKGDSKCHAIAAASILAKTRRDALMVAYDTQYPGYDFASHKGYPTSQHREAIRRLGPSPIHRRSFTLLPQPKLFD
jgi:ribonuclease HII